MSRLRCRYAAFLPALPSMAFAELDFGDEFAIATDSTFYEGVAKTVVTDDPVAPVLASPPPLPPQNTDIFFPAKPAEQIFFKQFVELPAAGAAPAPPATPQMAMESNSSGMAAKAVENDLLSQEYLGASGVR